MVIPNKYSYHFYIKPIDRINLLFNKGTFVQEDFFIYGKDPLNFDGYSKKLSLDATNFKNNEKQYTDSIISGYGSIGQFVVQISILDFNFLGGSIGSVVGEKITRCVEKAYSNKRPLIIVTSSGGARMHEGIFSLFQLAKINLALNKLERSKLPYISILTNPSLGGAMASFSTIGDLIIAEPGALIGFAGPRVIKATTNKKLPDGFQTSEFLLNKGLIDKIICRNYLRSYIIKFLNNFFSNEIS
ncbi:acetyl-CoA carboxylase carboxyl transferase subunit beta [Candidatus Pinguicoccus supinus]|uniref:Acetyl-CoA carboxylase carboxyl transferase subunit beta n=1 Tax=Candidatus Pinguicoccus supinus TaxID=2529394 RepID=A0A7T0BRL1_9BACT|nr:acetyl-CoA carboxylase carboxyl transferase subunit beta [Candidatus Pinguicoccus supinus]